MNKFIVIDLEGDGLGLKYNEQVFPDGNHYDPNTRLWCASFRNNFSDVQATYVCKIPCVRPLPRPYRKSNGQMAQTTIAVHYPDTVIKSELNGQHIIGFADYKDFLQRIASIINKAAELEMDVYYKAYIRDGKVYEYDRDVLRDNFTRYGIACNLSTMKPVVTKYWTRNHSMTTSAYCKPNQDYMDDAIKCNMNDTAQLLEYCKKEICQ